MVKPSPDQNQLSMFEAVLVQMSNPAHELCRLASEIDWGFFEREFAPLYSNTGRPAHPIRRMVGFLILKQLYNLSDENVVARWVENPCWQHFTGEAVFQLRAPFDPSELVHFRNGIGGPGAPKILKKSIRLHGNPYDGDTLDPALEQVEELAGKRPSDSINDRGYRGRKSLVANKVHVPSAPPAGQTVAQANAQRGRFRRRAAIEPRISHLKHDYRMGRNFLKGDMGDVINLLMASAAWNLRLWIRGIGALFLHLSQFLRGMAQARNAREGLERGAASWTSAVIGHAPRSPDGADNCGKFIRGD